MTNLITAMKDISTSSEETSKIIKNIDEITFQTNLLALNAAVEAARAGEAGSGFAVVADEIRNLAMRSAKAANDTSELIEDIITKIQGGSKIVKQVQEHFSDVIQKMNKVAQLIKEITSASQEQSAGISQISDTLSRLDIDIQATANNARNLSNSMKKFKVRETNIGYKSSYTQITPPKRDITVSLRKKHRIPTLTHRK